MDTNMLHIPGLWTRFGNSKFTFSVGKFGLTRVCLPRTEKRRLA